MIGLAHIDVLPFIYGVMLVVGFFSVWNKLATGLLYIAVIEVAFFAMMFTLHGGSMTGSLASVIAAVIVGAVLKRRHLRRHA